jgi:hypothetical protein
VLPRPQPPSVSCRVGLEVAWQYSMTNPGVISHPQLGILINATHLILIHSSPLFEVWIELSSMSSSKQEHTGLRYTPEPAIVNTRRIRRRQFISAYLQGYTILDSLWQRHSLSLRLYTKITQCDGGESWNPVRSWKAFSRSPASSISQGTFQRIAVMSLERARIANVG